MHWVIIRPIAEG
ncbi:Protein of unknown function [Bacillus wiedmannii]|nr:Protein of unknown function [Bacillus wiedmannii]